jgi:hypothetical protein
MVVRAIKVAEWLFRRGVKLFLKLVEPSDGNRVEASNDDEISGVRVGVPAAKLAVSPTAQIDAQS